MGRLSAKKLLTSRSLKTVLKPSPRHVPRQVNKFNIPLLLLDMTPRLDHLLLLPVAMLLLLPLQSLSMLPPQSLLLVTLLLLVQLLLDMPALDMVSLDMPIGNYHQDYSLFRQPTCFESSKYYRYNLSPQ